MMKTVLRVLGVLVAGLLISLNAAEPVRSHYVAVNGSAGASGESSDPWDLATAFAHPSRVQPGDTVWLRGGVYRGRFFSELRGAEGNPIVVRNYPGERVTIEGTGGPGESALTVQGGWVWFRGLEITSLGDAGLPETRGVVVAAEGTRFINLVVHGTVQAFSIGSQAQHTELYGNVIHENGVAGQRGFAAGIDVEAGSGQIRIAGNLIFRQAGAGLRAADATDLILEGNTFFDNGAGARSLHANMELETGQIRLIGNRTYAVSSARYGGTSLVQETACASIGLEGNSFADGVLLPPSGCQSELIQGNSFIGSTSGLDVLRHPDNVISLDKPIDQEFHLTRNNYESSRAHLAVYNWSQADRLRADASGFLAEGDAYEVREAGDPYGAPLARGIYQADGLEIPLNGEFQAFLLTKLSATPKKEGGRVFRLDDVPTQDLMLWLRADVGVTQAGGTVSQWTDQSGTGPNATQPTTANQPTYLASAFNGQPALEFDGVNDFLTFDLPLNGLSGMTMVLVSASTSSTQNGTSNGARNSPIFWNETAPWSAVHLSPYQSVVRFRFGTGQSNNLPSYTRPANIGTNHTITTAIKNGATETLYINGDQALTAGGKLTTLQGVHSTGNLGRGYNNDTYFAGRIAEVLVYTRALSDTERQALEEYLTNKYAPSIPVNQAPIVSAGPDQSTTLINAASLAGTVSDDGLPSGTPSVTWSKVSGPGTVTFANANAASTTATFSETGVYTLRLTGNDGVLSSSDDMVVTVSEPLPGTIPQTGLKLWLKADAGIVQTGGQVSQWADQSGSGTQAAQATSTSQPTFLASAFNGQPALEFDGINDFLTFNLPLNGLTGMTMVLVSASTSPTQDGSWHGGTHSTIFWNETSGWSTVNLSPYQGAVKFRFGTGQSNNVPSYTRPASIGTTHSVTTAIKDGAIETLYINGNQALTVGGKLTTLQGIQSTGNLGRGYNNNTYFAGRIAEVLVYARALTETERQALDQYLMDKYAPTIPVNQAPVVSAGADQATSLVNPANLNGSASDDELPSGTLTVTWSKVSGPGTVTFANANAGSTTATFSETGTYTLRLTADDGVLSSSDDMVVTVSEPLPGSIPQSGLTLWLKADAGLVQSGGQVSQWTDQSGSGRQAAQVTSASRPTFLASAFNGQPALEFDGVDDFLTFDMPLNGLSGMTMVLVSASTSPTQDGSWHGATHSTIFWNETSGWSTVNLSTYQGAVKFRFGTGQSNNIPSYTRPVPIGTNHSITTAIKSGATETLYINGGQVLTADGKLTTLQGVHPTGNLGRGYNNNTYFAGRIAEVLVYARALTATERQALEQYLMDKYALAAPVNQAPTVSAGADRAVTLADAASLNGTASDDGLPNGSLALTWSKVSGPGTVTFANANAASTTATFSETGDYTLRLTAEDGELSSSDDAVVTVSELVPGSIPQTGLKLWLKADAGVTQSGGQVSQWADQSGSGTNAAQLTTGSQPAFLASAFSGQPALAFDGVDDFLTFNMPLNGLSGMTMVLVSASTSPTQDGSWHGATHSTIFWNETSGWSTVNLSSYQDVVRFRFGTGQSNNIPSYTRPASIGSSHSVTIAIKDGATETLYVNGGVALTAGGKLTTMQGIQSTGNLGRGYNGDTYFAGRISEVLVYTRALTNAERQAVEQYLMDKYVLAAPVNQAPTVSAGADESVTLGDPASLNGTASDDDLPSGTLTLTWSKVSGPGTVTFATENAASTTATFSETGTYTLRLTADDGALSSSDDMAVTVSEPLPGSIPQTGLKLWLMADAGVTRSGGKVSQWADQSASGTHAAQLTGGSQPTFLASAFSGQPALQFDGTDDFLTFNLPLDGLSGMTMVLVSASTSSTQDGSWHGTTHSPIFWNETSNWSTVNLSPYQDVVRFRFGTGQADNLPSYTRPASIGGSHSVTTAIKNGATERLYINGGLVLTADGKLTTMQGMQPTGNLGRGLNNNTYFAGQIAEVLVYTRALTETERQAIEQYLSEKYAIAPPPLNQAPVVNAGPDQTIALGAAAVLNGSANDDGLPNGSLTVSWSKVSGPGTVTFANASAASTTATVSTHGTYVLRLSASDGAVSSSDDVVVVANPPPPPTITNVQVSALYSNYAVIRWSTDQPSDSQVAYGTTAAHGSFTPLTALHTTHHSAVISGLAPDTVYHYSARSRNADGSLGASSDLTFTTPSSPAFNTDGLVAHYDFSQADDRPNGVNELENAEDFENWIVWRGSSAIVTPNVAMAPNGTMTADRVWLRAPDGLLYHEYLPAVPGQTYTFSIYMRTESGTYPLRITRDNTVCWCGTTSPTLTVTDQWQRFTLTYTVNSGDPGSAVGFGYEDITPWNLPAEGEVLVWGAQVEPGSSATPYLSGVRDQDIIDLSGRNNHGWLGSTANPVFDANDPIRKTDALSWEGTPRWVQVPNKADLNRTTEGTWMMLVKPEAGWGNSATMLSRANGSGTATQYAIMRYGATNQFSFYTGDDSHPYRGGYVPENAWTVLTVTLSGGTVVGYISGVEVFQYSDVPALNTVAADLRVGVLGPSLNPYRGDVKSVMIYDRALTPAEVVAQSHLLNPSDTVAPQVSEVHAVSQSTTANIIWTTDKAADSRVEFGLSAALGQSSPLDPAFVTSHSLTLTGLTPSTMYYFRVISRDFVGNTTSSSVLTFTTLPAMPASGLRVWLKADEGVTQMAGGVSQLADHSGNGAHAVQTISASQPTMIQSAIAGRPALQFDGVNDFLTFTAPINGLSAMTLVLVSSSTNDFDGGANGVLRAPLFWDETAAWGAVHLSPFQDIVKFRFGTGQTNNLPQYSRLSSISSDFGLAIAVKDGTKEKLYIDGAQVLTVAGKLASINGVSDTGYLGRGYSNTYFAGQIAEVLVYDRVLTDAELLQVQQYLGKKYFSARPPVAVNDAYTAYTTAQGQSLNVASTNGVLKNDTDIDGDVLQAILVDDVTNGVLSLSSDGSFTYTPNANFQGADTFSYRASDSTLESNLATVTITVTAAMGDGAPTIVTGVPAFTKTVVGTGLLETHAVEAADFNGDGRMDFAATDYVNGRVLWYENAGNGTFTERVLDASLNGAYPLHVGDVDHDGKPDVLAGGYLGDVYVWYRNDGNGAFTRYEIGTQQGAHSIVTVDFDRDGDIDLLVANQDAGTVGWYENNGTNTFTWRLIDSSATGAKRAEFADLDGDGDLDVVAASFTINEIAWYENNGSQQFFKRVIDTVADGAYYVFPVDVDGDHDIDVLAASQIDGIVLYRNNGQGTFEKQVIDATASGARTVIGSDVDGDGHKDAIAASVNNDTVSWYQNDGAGNFLRQVIDSTANGAYGVFAVDMDEDGDTDVLSGNRDDDAVALHSQIRAHNASVPSGGIILFDATLLLTIDVDNGPSELTYTLSQTPTQGQLRLDGSTLTAGGTFTQADIDRGGISYRHNGSSSTQDSFAFAVDDGGGSGAQPAVGSFTVTVTP